MSSKATFREKCPVVGIPLSSALVLASPSHMLWSKREVGFWIFTKSTF